MNRQQFDDLARRLARDTSRRTFLRGLFGGITGGMLALRGGAAASLPNCPKDEPDCAGIPQPTIPPEPTAPPCSAPLVLCGDCVDLATDPNHCGACGTACSSGQCAAGSCVTYCDCAQGLTDCGPNHCAPQQCTFNNSQCDDLQCVDLHSDPDNCGACGNACSGSPCVAGACFRGCGCVEGRTDCGLNHCTDQQCNQNLGQCADVHCVDLTSDVANCGACGNACGGGEECVASTCVAPTQPAPTATRPAPTSTQPASGSESPAETPAPIEPTTPAGGATPLAALGLPEIKIIATDTGFSGVPSQLNAGRYLVTLTTNTTAPAQAGFMQLPPDVTFETFLDLLAKSPATPATGQSVSPLPWFYDTYLAGGLGAASGQTAQAVIDLTPGRHAVWGDNPLAAQRPAPLTVTGTAPAAPPAPPADLTIQDVNTAHGYAFQLEGTFKAGSHTVAVVNRSDQPHSAGLFRSEVPLDPAQAVPLFSLLAATTPHPGLPNLDQFPLAASAAAQSPGTTAWLALTLTPGTYVLACFVPDQNDGTPHAREGMVSAVTVT